MRRKLLRLTGMAAMAALAGCASAGPAAKAGAPSGAPAEAPEPVENARGALNAVMVDEPPRVDGTLSDPTWSKCPPLELGDCTSEKPGAAKTTARVLFGPKRLYVAWVCAQADTGKLRRNVTRRDGDVWKDDCVELFVSGDIREGYRHFIINADGVLSDSAFSRPKQEDKGWNSSATVKASVETGKRWIVTMSVPLAELGAYVGKGQTWVMNLNRTDPGPNPSQPVAEWSWAVMGTTDYHQVADFGRVVGVDVPRRADGVTRTATPPPAPPSYDKGSKAGGVTVYHRFGDVTIPDTGGGPAKAFDVKIRGADGLKLAFLARGTGGVRRVPLNMFDRRAGDNTTPKAYRHFMGNDWLPVIYFCDRFRYNGQPNSTVAKATDYTNIRFHGAATPDGKGALRLRDFVVYRGEDDAPPAAPTGLKAEAGKDGVRLTWERAEDNAGIALYVVSRAGKDGKFTKVGETPVPKYLDHPKRGACTYRVLAVDFQDNLSPWSKEAGVRSPATLFVAPAVIFDTALKALSGQEALLAKDRPGYAGSVREVHAAGKGKVRDGVVLMFGDSLTYATNYRTAVEGFLGRYRVEAKGYPAKRTSFGKGRIEGDLDAVNPEFCCILLGTNNSKSEKAIAAAMEDIRAMVASCRKRGTVAIVGTIPPRGFKDPASKGEAAYNAALIATCRAEKVPVAYLFEAFQAYGDRRKLLAGDGVHWSGEGFPMTGRVWKQAMDHVNFVLLDRP